MSEITLSAQLIVPGDHLTTLHYAAEHLVSCCQDAIQDHGEFYLALSGGSTPKALLSLLCSDDYISEIEWDRVHLFWGDERAAPPTSPESNFHMAMKAGLEKMLIPPHHIHRMIAEKEIEKHAALYEKNLRKILGDRSLDFVMLGMGEDGHTASLFPNTEALKAKGKLVVANHVPQKKAWRMTLTFDCINAASHIVFYVMGESKRTMLSRVFSSTPSLPCQFVGTPENPALWIADEDAAPEKLK